MLDMQVDPILAARPTNTVITISTVDIGPLIGISKPHSDGCKQNMLLKFRGNDRE